MPLIEGVGDEVTQFFVALTTVLIVCIAWWTTSISEQRQLRTVFLLDRQSRRDRTTVNRTNQDRTNTEETPAMSETQSANLETESAAGQPTSVKPSEAGSRVDGGQPASTSNAEEQEQNTIVQAMDAETNILRQRRIAYHNRGDTLIGEPAASLESSGSNEEHSQYASVPTEDEEFVLTEQHNHACTNKNKSNVVAAESTGNASTSNEGGEAPFCIKVKLKYINDDLKLVEGRLQETVGAFKRRNFDTELNSNKIVRLIFNGRVLQPEESTLQNCGLFDNCVVHCLIHNKRPSTADSTNGANGDDLIRRNHRFILPRANNNNQGRDYDLSNILYCLFLFFLGVAWYFRVVFGHLFTITATIALVGITCIFSVWMICTYFPEQETIPPSQDDEQR